MNMKNYYRGVIINYHNMSKKELERQVDILSKKFYFISHDDFVSNNFNFEKDFCLLTFDDGKKNNSEVVAPVLKSLGIPAIFYITTGFINTKEILWFDIYNNLYELYGEKENIVDTKIVLKMPQKQRRRYLDNLIEEFDFKIEKNNDDINPMKWSDVKKLAKWGFTIGAHSVNHSILTRETLKTAQTEIKDSINDIEQNINMVCNTFAFPNGNYNYQLIEYIKKFNIQTIMTTEPTWINYNSSYNRLPRIQLDPGFSKTKIESKLFIAKFGRFLKNPDGTGHLYIKINSLAKERN